MNLNKIPRAEYFSLENSLKYMGASQFKAFQKCEAKALAEIKGDYVREQSTALLQGKYFDAYFERNLDDFCNEYHSQIYKNNGDKYAYIQDVDRAITRVSQEPEFMRLATGQQQVIMTGLIQGVPFKIMIDSLLPDECIVDRKLMAAFPDSWVNGERLTWWMAWGYDYQAAIYQCIYEQNTGEQLPFRLAAASKEKEPDVKLCEFTQFTLDGALGEVIANVEHYQAVKQGAAEPVACGECDWCRKNRRIAKGDYELL